MSTPHPEAPAEGADPDEPATGPDRPAPQEDETPPGADTGAP